MRVAALHDAPVWGLRNARVPSCVLACPGLTSDADGLAKVDLLVSGNKIASLQAFGAPSRAADAPFLDLGGAIILPCFADVHVHLDKGHIWPRTPNPDGTFASALAATGADREAHWNGVDVRARMEFGLACAHAHGTRALRTHIDSIGPQINISWPQFAILREQWRDRLELQGVPLFGIDLALDDAHMGNIVDFLQICGSEILGAVTYMGPSLQAGLDRLFRLAAERAYDLDFHVDETRDPGAHSLRIIAETAIAHRFQGKILAGHCCSLAMQDTNEASRTIDLVARAGISVVSLPLCNMYLQDRNSGTTPRWRGIALLHELKAAGVPVMIASDNTRDPFYAYGDLDMMEVFREGTRIAHLDHPFGNWARAVSATPADLMRLEGCGTLAEGGDADFIIASARNFTELLSHPQMDRRLIRGGKPISAQPPPYRHLDSVIRQIP